MFSSGWRAGGWAGGVAFGRMGHFLSPPAAKLVLPHFDPPSLANLFPHPPTNSTPSLQVFTIHNMDFGQQKLGEAAYFSQKFTTVSPSYAWEVRARAHAAGGNVWRVGAGCQGCWLPGLLSSGATAPSRAL